MTEPITQTRPRRWAEEMLVPIDPAQFHNLQQRMAEKYAALDLHDREREEALAKIRDDRNELDRIGRTIASGGEKRMVTLEERHVFERSMVETVNVDTGLVLRSRAMTAEERVAAAQVELPMATATTDVPTEAVGPAAAVQSQAAN